MIGAEAEAGFGSIITENGDTTIRGKMEDVFEGHPKLSSLDPPHQPELGTHQIDARMKEFALAILS